VFSSCSDQSGIGFEGFVEAVLADDFFVARVVEDVGREGDGTLLVADAGARDGVISSIRDLDPDALAADSDGGTRTVRSSNGPLDLIFGVAISDRMESKREQTCIS
jgi:hypothetical protein